MDGTVVVLGGESLQGAPAVCMQLDDLHEERAGQLGLGRTEHLVPDGREKLGHHLRQLLFQETPGALQLAVRERERTEGGRESVRRLEVRESVCGSLTETRTQRLAPCDCGCSRGSHTLWP